MVLRSSIHKWLNFFPGNPRFVCEDIQHRQVNGYFSALETATPEIRERNIYLYKDITFKAPVLILGWVAQGKNGTLNGTLITKRGIIIEYAAHYLEDDGSFTRIYNTDKKSKSKKVKTLVYVTNIYQVIICISMYQIQR